ncbi:hypothetical protein [Patulibacter minatonensis]|uniref:hypothetical protein n=1 Tax=Patulibacter minatonensis TaxID=298163 RepID=UPI0004B77343|nr:hypothetical protein [Patulibacter minatonensis]
MRERHAFASGHGEGARSYQRFLDGLADAAAGRDNLRIALTGERTARVRIKLRGEPSYPIELRLEGGLWGIDEAAETATLR